MPGIFTKDTWINTVYAGSTLTDSVYLGDLLILGHTPQSEYTIKVNASDNANIRLTTFNTNNIVTNTSSASINAAPGDKVFYKITKDGYNTIYSWIDVNGNKTINNTLTENCFKYTIETPEVGEAEDEGYALYFKVRKRSQESPTPNFEGYIDWEDVKDITTFWEVGYETQYESITHTVQYNDTIYIKTPWATTYPSGVPYYSEKECINLVGYYTGDYEEAYTNWQLRTVNKRRMMGWLKEGYTETFTYKLPFQQSDTSYEASGGTLTVDWGDETSSTITGTLTDEKLTHVYTIPGKYQITITSSNNKMPLISFYDENITQHSIRLVSIDTPLLPFTNTQPNIERIFCDCEKLQSVCDQAFSNLTNVQSIYRAFYNCSSLLTLPKGILNIEGCTDYTETFRYASNLQNDYFFNPEILKNTNKVCIFDQCFEKLEYINRKTGVIQPLWTIPFKKTPRTDRVYDGNNVDSAINWYNVPESWGGPTNISVNVRCITDRNADILINDLPIHPTTMLSGEKFRYTIIPSNRIQFNPYNGLDYVRGAKSSSGSGSDSGSDSGSGIYNGQTETHNTSTYTVSKRIRRDYDFGILPEFDDHQKFNIIKVADSIFAIVNSPKYVYDTYDSSLYTPIYKYNPDRDRWYMAEGIQKDTSFTDCNYPTCAGIFKFGTKFFTVLRNKKVYSSTDGYEWKEETNTSGLSQYSVTTAYPESIASNNSNIAVIRLADGNLLYTENGLNYYPCSGVTNSSSTLYYLNNTFWIAYEKTLYKSSNGKTFSFNVELEAETDIKQLFYLNNRYFVQCDEGNPTGLWSSKDGINWKNIGYGSDLGFTYYNDRYMELLPYGVMFFRFDQNDNMVYEEYIDNRGGIDTEQLRTTVQLDNGIFLYGYYGGIRQYDINIYFQSSN